MKKLRFAGLVVVLFLSVSTVFGQKSSAILRAGINLANVSVTDDGRIDDAKMLLSFQVGIIGDLNVAEGFAIQPGIILTGKGSKTQDGDPDDPTYFKAKTNPIYVELPLNFVFKAPLDQTSRLFFGAGPYIAVGLGGKNKVEGKFLGAAFESESDIEWSDDDPSTLDYEEGAGFGIMKRFDYGLNGTAGFEFSNVIISVNYGLGLAKLQSGSDSGDDDNNKHRVLSFTMGFRL